MCVPQVRHQLSDCASSFMQSALSADVPSHGLHSPCSSTVSVEAKLTERMYSDQSFASKLHASCDSGVRGAIMHAMTTLLHLGATGT